MENHKKEFRFISTSILVFLWRGILVGLVSGTIVSLFRLGIELLFEGAVFLYHQAHGNGHFLILILGLNLLLAYLLGLLVKSEPDIKGSGIPQLEGELKGLVKQNWFSVFWKKFAGGLMSISMGLMLGREGPSIQLGAVAAKGLGKMLKVSPVEERVLLASGAAAGLSAAFNAPIAGLLFVVEEIYHHFSRLVWITALTASLTANFISLNIFGLRPVLDLPGALGHLPLSAYWLYLLLGLFLGLAGFLYEKVILNLNPFFDFWGRLFKLPAHFYGLISLLLIIPIGYYYPYLLGGGSHFIIDLTGQNLLLSTIFLYLLIRFVWSMVSYGSGLPGGIFLPMLTLGALHGLLAGRVFELLGFISASSLTIFLVLGMAGYFGAISKAPLTAIILVTEMVGDFNQLMAIATVTLMAYLTMDFLAGQPIYEAMLKKMLSSKGLSQSDQQKTTLIELPVTDKLAGQYVRDLNLPKGVLITSHVHHGQSQVVTGASRFQVGDTIFLLVKEAEVGQIRHLLT